MKTSLSKFKISISMEINEVNHLLKSRMQKGWVKIFMTRTGRADKDIHEGFRVLNLYSWDVTFKSDLFSQINTFLYLIFSFNNSFYCKFICNILSNTLCGWKINHSVIESANLQIKWQMIKKKLRRVPRSAYGDYSKHLFLRAKKGIALELASLVKAGKA